MLAALLLAHRVSTRDLAAVQRRRTLPTVFTQTFQRVMHRGMSRQSGRDLQLQPPGTCDVNAVPAGTKPSWEGRSTQAPPRGGSRKPELGNETNSPPHRRLFDRIKSYPRKGRGHAYDSSAQHHTAERHGRRVT
jgi:hypothetical protein